MSTSLSTAVPTVNIVMAFDIEVIHLLKQSQSLEIFQKAVANQNFTKEQVSVFRNGPASDFLSLRHTWDKMPVLELEFLDPENTFESKLFTTDVNQLMPLQADLASQLMAKDQNDYNKVNLNPAMGKSRKLWEKRIKQLEKTIALHTPSIASIAAKGLQLNPTTGKRIPTYDPHMDEMYKAQEELDWLRSGKGTFEAFRMERNERKEGWKRTADAVGGIKNLDKLYMIEQMNAQKKLMQRTVYITYGVGNDFSNWAPVMCFDTAVGMEYNYTGAGVRKLKLIYSAAGIDANLTNLGMSPLKALGIGQVLQGQSMPLFNKEVMEDRLGSYQDSLSDPSTKDVGMGIINNLLSKIAPSQELDNLFSSPYAPCIHDVFCDIFKDYIMRATGYTNVLIALPDLDKLLKHDYHDAVGAAMNQLMPSTSAQTVGARNLSSPSMTKEIEISGWKQFIEKYGMKMADTKKTIQKPQSAVQGATKEEDNPFPISIEEHYKKYDVRTVFSSNTEADLFFENKLIEPLNRLCNNITKALIGTTALPYEFSVDFSIENDWDTLNLMYATGLISELKPVLIFGDEIFKDRYLYASQLDDTRNADTAEKIAYESVLSVSPVDKAKGLDDDYMKSMHTLRNPPLWVTPFGPTGKISGKDEYFLTDDTNIKVNAYEELKDSYKKATMPVFTLGTRNTNVLSINLDINKVYLTLINKFKYQTINASQIINAVVPKNKLTSATKGNLATLSTVLTGKTDALGIPVGFKEKIRPFLKTTQFDKDMYQVFKSLGLEEMSAMEVKTEEARYHQHLKALDQSRGGSEYTELEEKHEEDERILSYWKRFQAMEGQYPGIMLQLGGADTTQGAINHNTLVTDAMSKHAFNGTIKTLPMFHLSNYKNVIMRDVLLYSIEPSILGGENTGMKNQQSWFSGMYQLQGFTHTISKSSVTSEFSIVRTPNRGGNIQGSKEGES